MPIPASLSHKLRERFGTLTGAKLVEWLNAVEPYVRRGGRFPMPEPPEEVRQALGGELVGELMNYLSPQRSRKSWR